jgi:hypothetical protein
LASPADQDPAPPVTGARLKALLTSPFDAAVWHEAMGEDCHLRIGNAPTRLGRDAALPELAAFCRRVEGFGCGFCQVWKRRETIFAETEVQFRDRQGRPARIPCVIVARATEGRLRDLRLHLDPAPIP